MKHGIPVLGRIFLVFVSDEEPFGVSAQDQLPKPAGLGGPGKSLNHQTWRQRSPLMWRKGEVVFVLVILGRRRER